MNTPRHHCRRIISWNVNGLRAAHRKGFLDWLQGCEADFVGIQETRATADQLPDALRQPPGWHAGFVSAERKGYSGVGYYARRPADSVADTLGQPMLDREGRLQLLTYGDLLIANAYFPNGSGPNRDHSRIPYKLAFYDALLAHLRDALRAGRPILVMGDFNTAFADIDLSRPRQNKRTSGFTLPEREALGAWFDAGFVDTFRRFEPAGGHYSWWSQRAGVRERNIGWRIDYVLASPAAMRFVTGAFLWPHVRGSDHCPVGVTVSPAIYGEPRRP